MALGKIGDWNGLQKFAAKAKTPPIGFIPFARACIDNNKPFQAAKYISRVRDDNKQIDLYIQVKMFTEATEIALRRRDFHHRIPEILRACDSDRDLQGRLLSKVRQAGVQI